MEGKICRSPHKSRIKAITNLKQNTMSQSTSFANDIQPMFAQYRDRMTWRLDLTLYEDVKDNADIIYYQISTGQMPPANQGRLTQDQIDLFKLWMDQGCPQ